MAREMPKQLHLGCQCVMPTYNAWHGDGLKTDRNSHGDKEFRVWFGMEIVHLFQLSLLVPASLTFITSLENSDSKFIRSWISTIGIAVLKIVSKDTDA